MVSRFGFSLLFTVLLISISTAQQHPVDTMSNERFTDFLLKLKNDTLQPPVDFTKKLDPEKCEADLRIYKRVLEEAHTPIYRYTSKPVIDQQFERAFAQAQDSMTYLMLFQNIARIQNLIGCGHSGRRHSTGYKKFRDTAVGIFPLDIKIREGRYFVYRDNSMQQIEEGTEIISINGLSVSQITDSLQLYMYRDGECQDNMDIEKHLPMAYSNFIDNPGLFEVKVVSPNYPEPLYMRLKPLLKSEVDSTRNFRYGKGKQMGTPLEFEIVDSAKTGIYTIKWFRKDYHKKMGQDFEKFTDSVFAELRKHEVENLIIDLRNNTGGWTAYGKYLFSYFINNKRPYMKSVETKKYTDYSFEPIIFSQPGYSDTMELELNKKGLYEWKNYPSFTAAPQKENGFEGKVYVLTNGYTRSCSSVFSSLMRENTNAVFIGSEVGGAQCGSSAIMVAIQLPYSKIDINISTAQYNYAVSNSSDFRGVQPDVEVIPQAKNLTENKDEVLQTAFDLINQ